MRKYINIHTDNVELTISVTDKLKKQEGNLKGFGWINVFTGMKDEENVSWDNLNFFIQNGYKKFKKECKEDLIGKGFKPKKIFKEIKQLLEEAVRLDLL